MRVGLISFFRFETHAMMMIPYWVHQSKIRTSRNGKCVRIDLLRFLEDSLSVPIRTICATNLLINRLPKAQTCQSINENYPIICRTVECGLRERQIHIEMMQIEIEWKLRNRSWGKSLQCCKSWKYVQLRWFCDRIDDKRNENCRFL